MSTENRSTGFDLRGSHRVPFTGVLAVLVAFLGVWLFFTPFVMGYGQPARVTEMVVGVAAMFAGVLLVLRAAHPAVVGAFVVGLGVWLIAVPLLMPIAIGPAWNALTVGAALTLIGLATFVASAIDRSRGRRVPR